jgi:glyoxylate reductase
MKWDEGLLRALAPRCKVYLGPGAGYDKVDVDWISSTYALIYSSLLLGLIDSGAYYCNSPIAVGRRTADGAIMLLLAAMRGLVSQVSFPSIIEFKS